MTGASELSRNGIVAESLVAVAFALQLVVAIGILLGSAYATFAGVTLLGLPDLSVYGAIIGLATLCLLAVAYVTSYAPTRLGDYRVAVTPTLALGIIFCVLGVTILIGVLYLLSYGRLQDALRESGELSRDDLDFPTAAGSSPQPREDGLVPCVHCSTPIRPTDIICRKCGQSRWAAGA